MPVASDIIQNFLTKIGLFDQNIFTFLIVLKISKNGRIVKFAIAIVEI